MKLIIEYDPWAERIAAKRAAEALKTLGMPVQLREVRHSSNYVGRQGISRDVDLSRVVFETDVREG